MIHPLIRKDLAWAALAAVAGLVLLLTSDPLIHAVAWLALVAELTRALLALHRLTASPARK